MDRFIVAQKVKQEQSFDETHRRMVVTKLKLSDTYVTRILTPEDDGYFALQVAYGTAPSFKNISKIQQGKLKKAGIEAPLRYLREIRLDSSNGRTFTVGEQLKAQDMFTAGDEVIVHGKSKGKGFQGVVRRHGFAGGPKTHGQSDRLRSPGSIGQRMTPGRVFKGLKMAGRMGNETVTVKGLHVISVDDTHITLRGLVPGSVKSTIFIQG